MKIGENGKAEIFSYCVVMLLMGFCLGNMFQIHMNDKDVHKKAIEKNWAQYDKTTGKFTYTNDTLSYIVGNR